MAGTQRGEDRSSTGNGARMRTPARLSPTGSMEGTLDLLTGLFPASDLFGPGIAGTGGTIVAGGVESSNSHTQVGSMGTETSPSLQDLLYESAVSQQQQQQEPLDLLTGLFPQPSRTPSPGLSPNFATSTMCVNSINGWRTDVNGHPAFGVGGSHSNELFGSPVISMNNPFLDNAAMARSLSPTLQPPTLQPIPLRVSNVGWTDGSFAMFPPVSENITNFDLGCRSQGTSFVSPPNNWASRPQSVGTGSSPTNANSVSKTTSSSNLQQGREKSEANARQSSEIGLERVQNGASRPESPRRTSQHTNVASNKTVPSVSPPQIDNMRRGSHEAKSDQWGSSGHVARTPGKELGPLDSRASMPSTTASASNDEFVGVSGGQIYRAPARGAVHPKRPVSLELRPHPLRGALANQVTRLSCLEESVWAVCETGLLIWDVENATGQGSSGTGNILGDEDAASSEFVKFQGSSATCIVSDVANQVVWTGHRDGKLRAWSTRAPGDVSRESRTATLSFQAHRPAVTALVITPYGELWAASESGELKAWPWEAVWEALSGNCDGTALMEKCYHDLRVGNFGTGPNGPINPEIRFLVGDHARGTVWCAGTLYIAIWDARTRERVKIFVGPNGLDLNNLEVESPGKEILYDEDWKGGGYAKVSGKREKGGWLQRSRNAVLGAADAVRRVASGGNQGGDDSRRLEALVALANGTIWGGYGSGILTQWDSEGYRLQEVCTRSVGVRCMCAVGNRLWVGYSDGKLQIFTDNGKPVGSWLAHRFAVLQMVHCGGYVFSLGLNGSIRGWRISFPSNLDALLAEAMTKRADSYTSHRHLRVLAATWNTAQERASPKSVRTWLTLPSADASIVVVGLQEVEMGAGAIGMAAVKETVGLEKGSAAGLWWLGLLDTILGEGNEFERVGNRQLAGMLIGVWVRRKLLPYVGDVEVGAVACGFGRALGNKGAVGVKLMIFRRTICVLTSHLAAHMEHVSRRNADFEHIYNQMSFSRITRGNSTGGNAAAGVSNAVQSMLRGSSMARRVSMTSDQNFVERDTPLTVDSDAGAEDVVGPELQDADLLIWTGDLNYRINYLSYEETLNLIYKKQWDSLLSHDQLRYEMGNGRTFHGLREGPIRFQPTYKFDRWTTVYDTSEKKRIPAWCDRVLFRDSFGSASEFASASKHALARPCRASVDCYEACMEPEESDHKPVRCMLNVDLSVIDEKDRRREYGLIMRSNPQVLSSLAMSDYIPEIVLTTNRLVLEDSAPSILRLSNGDRQHQVLFDINCTGVPSRGVCPCGQHSLKSKNKEGDQYPRGSYGFPDWLKVVPACGVLGPCDSVSISVKKPEDRSKDQEPKVILLLVNVRGIFSSKYKRHMICVSCAPSNRKLGKEKDGHRRRLQDVHGRSFTTDKDSQIHASRTDLSSSSITKNARDLLL